MGGRSRADRCRLYSTQTRCHKLRRLCYDAFRANVHEA